MQMPVIFFGHGSPMNAIADNPFTRSWREIGECIKQRPRAIVIFSAHWITRGETRIGVNPAPNMIYDMYGFPEELYQVDYSSPSAPDIAEDLMRVVSDFASVTPDSHRGYDHGIWSTLIHAFPDADIPVIPISFDYNMTPSWHYEFGRLLIPLREKDILFIGSGNIVHNLSRIDPSGRDQHPWAKEFDTRMSEYISLRDYHEVLKFQEWGSVSRLAHPSYDHLLPIFPLLGLLSESDDPRYFTPDIVMGSISMRSIIWQ